MVICFVTNVIRNLLSVIAKSFFKLDNSGSTMFQLLQIPQITPKLSLRRKWNFRFRVYPVNATKSAVSCGFGQMKNSILCDVYMKKNCTYWVSFNPAHLITNLCSTWLKTYVNNSIKSEIRQKKFISQKWQWYPRNKSYSAVVLLKSGTKIWRGKTAQNKCLLKQEEWLR